MAKAESSELVNLGVLWLVVAGLGAWAWWYWLPPAPTPPSGP